MHLNGSVSLREKDKSQRGEMILQEGEDSAPAEIKTGMGVIGQDKWRQKFPASGNGLSEALSSARQTVSCME